MKICNNCGKSKNLEDFNKNKTNRDGLRYDCRSCSRIASILYNNKNKEKASMYRKLYYNKNKEIILEKSAKYYKTHYLRDKEYRDAYNIIYGKGYRIKFNQQERDRVRKYYYENKEIK